MSVQTSAGVPMSNKLLCDYFKTLINRYYKILPLWEDGEKSLKVYMRSLQAEMLGFMGLVDPEHSDPLFVTLLSVLQYLIDTPDCSVAVVKREVFRAINVCNKLNARYSTEV